jgi:site-specific DNA-methyltransferase (adenine-specific)
MIDLRCGDCLELMKDIPDKSINLVLIDPPYNIKKAKWDKWKTVNDYVEFMGKVFLEIQRVLKDNGSFYFFHNDFLQIVELQNYINNNTKFIFKSFLVWNKRFNEAKNKGFLDGFCEVENLRNYQQMAEYCLYYTLQDENNLTDDPPYCFKSYLDYMTSEKEKLNWDIKQFNDFLGYKAIASHWFYQDKNRKKQRQPRFISEKDYLKLKQTGCFQKEYRELKEEYESKRYTFNNLKYHHSVMDYEIAPKQGHITPKPVDLLEYIIKTSSNENDVVLDCFMGSGSTGVACINTNRNFIGIELDEKYFEIAKNRIEDVSNRK